MTEYEDPDFGEIKQVRTSSLLYIYIILFFALGLVVVIDRILCW